MQKLKNTSINITCYDRNGDVVKRVTSSDDGTVEDPDNAGNTDNSGGSTGTETGSGGGSGSDADIE